MDFKINLCGHKKIEVKGKSIYPAFEIMSMGVNPVWQLRQFRSGYSNYQVTAYGWSLVNCGNTGL